MKKRFLLLLCLFSSCTQTQLPVIETYDFFDQLVPSNVWGDFMSAAGLNSTCRHTKTPTAVGFRDWPMTNQLCRAMHAYGCAILNADANILYVSEIDEFGKERDIYNIWHTILHERLHVYYACAASGKEDGDPGHVSEGWQYLDSFIATSINDTTPDPRDYSTEPVLYKK